MQRQWTVVVFLALMIALQATAHEYIEFSGKVVGVIDADIIEVAHTGRS